MDKKIFYVLFLLIFIFIPLAASAQNQSPCTGSVHLTDTSQAEPDVLVVVSNSAQASFTLTGPGTYHGSGYYWAQKGIPIGTYTITWNGISGCTTPASEIKATDSHGSVAFAGNYQIIGSFLTQPTEKVTQNKEQISTTSPVPTIVQSQGVFLRIFSSFTSFLKNLFHPENKLQGAWMVEKRLIFDPLFKSFREIPAQKQYIEFKNDKICPDGSYFSNGVPVVCQLYSTFHTDGNKIISENLPFWQTVTWKFIGKKLELTIESQDRNGARSQKLTLSKIENFHPESLNH